jgi:hypothetical protein
LRRDRRARRPDRPGERNHGHSRGQSGEGSRHRRGTGGDRHRGHPAVAVGAQECRGLAVRAGLSDATGIAEINYTIAGNGIEPITGTAQVTDPRTATAIAAKDIPVDTEYSLQLTAASSDGKNKCGRKLTFDVTLGKTTALDVVLQCHDLSRIAQFLNFRKTAPQGEVAAATPPPAIEVPPECTECEKEGVENGICEKELGCESLQGQDKTLCVNLVNCMRATNCWVKDPLDCLCGTAKDEACITNAANGVCRAEMQAATKSTNPIENGTLFYDISVPAGLANRLLACDRDKCVSHCSLPQ